jgi:hypothetical protein
VPDQTLSQGSVPGGRSADDGVAPGTTRGIVLGVRLWTQDSSGQAAAVSWQSAAPIAHLALDLITASGGAPEPAKGSILRAGFYSAQSALLMVRRLQWALQGFAEREESRGVAAAMLIHSLQDPAGEPIATALENAEPGQILLSGAIAESVNQLPNVALRASAQAGLVEVQWRSSEPDPSGAADEQAALRLIRQLGREDPVPSLPQQAPISKQTQPPPAEAPPAPVVTGSFVSARRDEDEEVAAGGGKKKWLILVVAAAVLVIAAILIIPGLVSGHREKAAAPAVPDTSTRPVEPVTPGPPPPSTSDTAVKPEPAKPLPQKPERIPATDKTKPSPDGTTAARVPAAPAGTCELTEGEIPRSLSRAESYMHAGRLTDAQAVYQRLLGCPSARQRAAEGLQLVKQRIAAGPSEQ